MDRLTKSAHFIPVRTDYSLQKLAKLYVSEIVRVHRVPVSIISDRDHRFTSRLWGKLHEALGTRLDFSTAFYPHTDSQSERVIQILDVNGLCKRLPRQLGGLFSIGGTELGERRILCPELVSDTKDKVRLIRDLLKKASNIQKSYADLKRREIEYSIGDFVFLKVSPWKKILKFGRNGNLSPRFIGPYLILRRVGPVAYQLKLPPELEWIHDVFYISMLRHYRSDPIRIIPVDEIKVRSDLSFEEEPIQILDRDVKVKRKTIPLVKVLWNTMARRRPRGSLRMLCDSNILICSDQVARVAQDDYGPTVGSSVGMGGLVISPHGMKGWTEIECRGWMGRICILVYLLPH
ncbi:reverse transcriptase [Gossypium australe]|uniref:Reverse transcriptase n=1 Tax=Gossypium australe TaxID=47621 RepID=A0A5B6X010_9ROSI|nr:reverse transcriptase [Gossypium australe]